MSAPLFQTCNANICLFFQKQTFFLNFLISFGFSGEFHKCGRMENRVGNRSESKNLIGELKEIESLWFLRHWLFRRRCGGGNLLFVRDLCCFTPPLVGRLELVSVLSKKISDFICLNSKFIIFA